MEATRRTDAHRVAELTRLFLLQLGVTLIVIGFPLFVLTEHTDDYFAWTINPPLTAAFLGANYWGSAVLALLSARERTWAAAGVAMPGIFVAGTLLLLATFLHLEPFHMDTVRGWLWVILYALLPPSVVTLVVLQRRVDRHDAPKRAPLAAAARLTLLAQALAFLGVGAALFIAPGETASIWPWTLSDLTARAIAAWLLAIGTTTVASLRADDWSRLLAPMTGYAAIAALQLVALARYRDTLEDNASGWVYVAFMISVLAVGIYGSRMSLRSRAT
jgi:hypothetical protein